MLASRTFIFAASLLAAALSFSAQAEAGCYHNCSSRASYQGSYSVGLRATYGHAGYYNQSYSYGAVNRQAYGYSTPRYATPVGYYGQQEPYYSEPAYTRQPAHYRPAYGYEQPRYSQRNDYGYQQPRYSQRSVRRHVSYRPVTSYVPVSRVKTMTVLKAQTRIVPVRAYKKVTTYHPVRVRKVVTRYQPVTTYRRSVSYRY